MRQCVTFLRDDQHVFFDILQIPRQCIQIFKGLIAPTDTPLAMGLVSLRSPGKFASRYKTINSNICLQLLEVCLTVKNVSAHTSSTVFRRSVHTLTSFIFWTRVVHCTEKTIHRNLEVHYCIYAFESQERILNQCN